MEIKFIYHSQAWPPFLFFHAIHAHVSDLFEALPRKTETWLFTVHQLNMLLFDNAFALQCFAYICRYFGRGTLLMFFSKRQGKVTRVGRLTNPPLPIGFVSLQIRSNKQARCKRYRSWSLFGQSFRERWRRRMPQRSRPRSSAGRGERPQAERSC